MAVDRHRNAGFPPLLHRSADRFGLEPLGDPAEIVAEREQDEAGAEAENAWVEHNNAVASPHIRSACSSWYIGANIPGKPRVFMPYVGGFPAYVKKCEEVVAAGYAGFELVRTNGSFHEHD